MLQFGASLTDDTRSVNYDRNMFIIQATGGQSSNLCLNADHCINSVNETSVAA